MSIRDWPEQERPRERLLAQGPAALSDAELLAIFLRTGSAGVSALCLARELLIKAGSLRELFDMDRATFCAIPGLGNCKYAQLQAMLEMARRHLGEQLSGRDALHNPADTRNYLSACLRDQDHEIFACLFLDTRHRVIRYEELFHGTIDGASVHPRQVVKRTLHHNAAAIILAHNHPSGVAEPSQADRLLTNKLRDALALIDVRVLDHLVVGDGEVISFAERGLI